jgi:prepilin-type processing-associated H-X9-DG protein/prepilin-type N-terminal cleavage/methylation domain-containing protein
MKRFAFTLVELLVVLVIIVMLMAVLLPALRHSRQEAEAAICGSNISQLLRGLFSYETENQVLPYGLNSSLTDIPPGGYPGFSPPDEPGWWWFNFIEGFYEKSRGKDTVICCPSKRLSDPKFKMDVICGNYGINHSICKSFDDKNEEFKGAPLRGSNIPRPGETLLIVDSGYALISWRHATDNPPVPLGISPIKDTSYVPGLWINKNRNLWPWQKYDAINGRHPKKTVNVGFADGHLSRTKADDLFVEKIGSGYKNKSPLWVPK